MKKLLSYPLFISWDLTYKCNIKCIHCFFGNYNSSLNEELDTLEIKELLKKFSENKVISIQFAGGEPLMRKDCIEILDYSINLGIITTLATNGLFLNEKITKKLKKIGISSIQVSLDGFLEEHEYIRGKGTYNETIASIKRLVEYKIPFSVAIAITNLNYQYIDKFINELYNIGVKAIRLQFLLLEGRARDNKNLLYIDTEKLEKIVKKALNNKYIKNNMMKLILPCYYPKVNEKIIQNNDFSVSSFISNSCGAGTTSVNIDPYGNVTACGILTGEEWYAGNLKTKELKEIWNNSFELEKWRKYSVPNGCEECNLLSKCFGGCRANSWLLNKNFDTKDPYCWR